MYLFLNCEILNIFSLKTLENIMYTPWTNVTVYGKTCPKSAGKILRKRGKVMMPL
jgi:hypothetical protein